MKQQSKKKRSMAMSKKILILSYVILIVCIVFTFIAIICDFKDLNQLEYINIAAFGQCAAITPFYYIKSQKENSVGGIIHDKAMQECDGDQAG